MTSVVGRDAELAILDAHMQRAAAGNGGCVLLVGDPGIGKTRVMDAAAERADASGWLTLRFRPGAGPPANPLQAVLDPIPDDDAELDALGVTAQIRRLEAAVGQRADARTVRRVADQIIARVSQHQPVLVAVDDLHTADSAFVDLVAHVARRSRHRRVLVVAAARPVGAGAERLGDLADVFLLPIEPLDREAGLEFLATVAGITDDTAGDLAERAGGNPLYLTELAVVASGVDGTAEAATLPLLVTARLDRLGGAPRRVVEAAAVATHPWPARLCALVAGLDTDDTRPVDEAVAAGFLTRDTKGRLDFTQRFVRELIVTAIPSERRRSLHARAAGLLSLLDAGPEEVAHHALGAGLHGDTRTVELALDAARAAQQTGSPSSALQWADRALALGPDPATESDLLVVRGEALLFLGRNSEAVAEFERALAVNVTERARLGLARSLQRDGRLDAALDLFGRCAGAGADRGRAEVLLALGRCAEAQDASAAAVIAARTQGDTPLVASTLADRALVLAVTNQPDAVATAQDAVTLWREVDEDTVDWPPLYALGVALESADRFGESLASLGELRAWLDAVGNVESVPPAARTETIAAFLSCSWGRMREAIAAACDVRTHQPIHEMGPVWAASATLAAALGDGNGWRRGLERARETLAARSTPFDEALASWWTGIGRILRLDFADAHRDLAAAAAGFRRLGALDFLARTLPTLCLSALDAGAGASIPSLAEEFERVTAGIERPSVHAGRQTIASALTTDPEEKAARLVAAAEATVDSEHRAGFIAAAARALQLSPESVPPRQLTRLGEIVAATGWVLPAA